MKYVVATIAMVLVSQTAIAEDMVPPKPVIAIELDAHKIDTVRAFKIDFEFETDWDEKLSINAKRHCWKFIKTSSNTFAGTGRLKACRADTIRIVNEGLKRAAIKQNKQFHGTILLKIK